MYSHPEVQADTPTQRTHPPKQSYIPVVLLLYSTLTPKTFMKLPSSSFSLRETFSVEIKSFLYP